LGACECGFRRIGLYSHRIPASLTEPLLRETLRRVSAHPGNDPFREEIAAPTGAPEFEEGACLFLLTVSRRSRYQDAPLLTASPFLYSPSFAALGLESCAAT
jgi:hypothetical protein